MPTLMLFGIGVILVLFGEILCEMLKSLRAIATTLEALRQHIRRD